MTKAQNNIPHSTLAKRVQAMIIDGMIVAIGFVVLALIFSNFESINGFVKFLIVVLAALLYEPVLIWRTGSTVGQRLKGIRVRKLGSDHKLNYGESVLRFFLKMILGCISLFFVMGTKNRQALHDMAVGSCVVVIDPAKSPDDVWLAEKNVEEPDFIYPSKTRRVVFIVLYILAVSIVFGIIDDMVVSSKCSDRTSACLAWEKAFQAFTGLGAFLLCC
jgi:uncharacterized RDD family membrane protein YckC